ncbi:hypothetical protein ACHAP5_008867 [Fusarium lateritium]
MCEHIVVWCIGFIVCRSDSFADSYADKEPIREAKRGVKAQKQQRRASEQQRARRAKNEAHKTKRE